MKIKIHFIITAIVLVFSFTIANSANALATVPTGQVKEKINREINEIKTERRQKIVERITNYKVKVIDRLSDSILRIETNIAKVEDRIVKFEAKGVVLTEAKQLIAESKAKITIAEIKITELKAKIDSIIGDTITPDSIRIVKDSALEVKKMIIGAHAKLIDAISSIKMGLSKKTPPPPPPPVSVEVPVAPETPNEATNTSN